MPGVDIHLKIVNINKNKIKLKNEIANDKSF